MSASTKSYTFAAAAGITLLMCLPGVITGALIGCLFGGWLAIVLFAIAGAFFAFCVIDGAGVAPLLGDPIP